MAYDDKEVAIVHTYVRTFGSLWEAHATTLTGGRPELLRIAIGEGERGLQR